MTNVWDTVLHLSTSQGCSCPLTFASNNRLDNTQRGSFLSDLHTKPRIISMSVSCLAAGFPCVVWDCGWTTCLLCDGAHLVYVLKRQLMCKLIWWGAIFHQFLAFVYVFAHYPRSVIFLLYFVLLLYNFLSKVLYITIFRRPGLDSFLWSHVIVH